MMIDVSLHPAPVPETVKPEHGIVYESLDKTLKEWQKRGSSDMFEWSALASIAVVGMNAAIIRKAVLGQEAWTAFYPSGDPGGEVVVPRQLAALVASRLADLAGLRENEDQQKVAARKAEECFKEVLESGKILRLNPK